jgi:hypothetical protein
MSIAAQIHSAARQTQRLIRGESVTLRDSAGATLVMIVDAIVIIDRSSVTRGDGPAEIRGIVRLAETHHANAVLAHTCTAQGEAYSVIHVGDVINGECVVILGKADTDHTNLFDLHDTQAVWGSA